MEAAAAAESAAQMSSRLSDKDTHCCDKQRPCLDSVPFGRACHRPPRSRFRIILGLGQGHFCTSSCVRPNLQLIHPDHDTDRGRHFQLHQLVFVPYRCRVVVVQCPAVGIVGMRLHWGFAACRSSRWTPDLSRTRRIRSDKFGHFRPSKRLHGSWGLDNEQVISVKERCCWTMTRSSKLVGGVRGARSQATCQVPRPPCQAGLTQDGFPTSCNAPAGIR